MFSTRFNHNVDNVKFPDLLESITFGRYFSENINDAKFPPSLKIIEFDTYYNNQMNCELELDELKIKYLYESITNLPIGIKKIIFSKINDNKNKKKIWGL